MIKHIVMWGVAGETREEKDESIRKIKAAFDEIVGVIPGLMSIEIGVDISGSDYACDVVLYSEFESHDALKDYASHPVHLMIKEKLAWQSL